MNFIIDRGRLDAQGRIVLPQFMRGEGVVRFFQKTDNLEQVFATKCISEQAEGLLPEAFRESKLNNKGRVFIPRPFRPLLSGDIIFIYVDENTIALRAESVQA